MTEIPETGLRHFIGIDQEPDYVEFGGICDEQSIHWVAAKGNLRKLSCRK
jgi:hypothetical protein